MWINFLKLLNAYGSDFQKTLLHSFRRVQLSPYVISQVFKTQKDFYIQMLFSFFQKVETHQLFEFTIFSKYTKAVARLRANF